MQKYRKKVIVVCIILIILTGLTVFCKFDYCGAQIGMSLEKFENLMPRSDHYEYGRYMQEGKHVFYPNRLGQIVVAEFNFNESKNTYVITDIRTYQEKLPLHLFAAFVKEGMSKFDVVNLLGSPVGFSHSGLSCTEFNTLDGSVYEVYWHNSDQTVSDIILVKDNRLVSLAVIFILVLISVVHLILTKKNILSKKKKATDS